MPDPERRRSSAKPSSFYATGTYTLDRLTETMNGLGLTNGAGTRHKGKPLSRASITACSRTRSTTARSATAASTTRVSTSRSSPRSSSTSARKSLRARASRKRRRFKPYLYRGLFRCGECGCFITTETQKGHNYLRCTKRVKKDCSQPYVREEKIAEQITEVLAFAARRR